MKFSFFLLLFIGLQIHATGYSQSVINMDVENMTIRNVLKTIEEKTDYRFFYSDDLVFLDEKINLSGKNLSINEALNRLLENSRLGYRIYENNMVIISLKERLEMQGIQISGTVTDEYGDPMPGVNIMLKGTSTGVVSDLNGNYALTVLDKEAILVFSFMGYKTIEIQVGEQTNISVQMEEDRQQLEEVIVVGYGTMRKSDLTGTVVRADINAFAESPNTSILQSLQGSVPGLNVGQVNQAGSDPTMSIRGTNSISGSSTPLVVLDGIIYRGSLIDLNPNDVQSIDVLKDASATAIYGSQAANGVLIVTTKTGVDMGKPIISYSGSVSWQFPTTDDIKPSGRQGFLDKIAATFIEESRTGADLLTANPGWDPTSHLMDKNAVDGYNAGVDTDWWGLMNKDNGFIQDHNLGVRGKTKSTAGRTSS